MTGEGNQDGNGYEHAGGYKSALTFSWREIGFLIFVLACVIGFNMLLDSFVPHGPARDLYNVVLGVAALLAVGWMILRGDRSELEEFGPNPMSVLYPERFYDDAKARRRRRRIWAVVFVTALLAGTAFSIRRLLETGVPAESVPAVILIAAALLITIVLADAYHRRRRQDSTE